MAPPFSIIENNEYKGIELDLMKIIASRMGLEIQFVECLWKRCLSKMKSGKIAS